MEAGVSNIQNASENRGVQNDFSSNSPSNNASSGNMVRKPTSFSNIVKASSCPKKDQAIIFPAIDGLQVKDYVFATGDIIDPKDIHFASRMSNNRICLYFSSKEIVEKFVGNKGGIDINGMFIPARKLVQPAKRIIISNVQPVIPQHIIEEELKDKGIKLLSPVSYIGAGMGRERFNHICSFRRQVFISPEQVNEIPTSLEIYFDGETYRIFFSDDKVKCFRCNEFGHIASNCVNITETVIASQDNVQAKTREEVNKNPSVNTGSFSIKDNLMGPVTQTEGNSLEKAPGISTKRALSTNTDSLSTAENLIEIDSDSNEISTDFPEITGSKSQEDAPHTITTVATIHSSADHTISKPTCKRIRTESPDRDSYKDIEKLWQSNNNFELDYTTFTDFLSAVKGTDKPLEVAKLYTDNIAGLVKQINSVRTHFHQRHIRDRCKRLITNLRKAVKDDNFPDMSPPLSRTPSRTSSRRSASNESINSIQSF